MTTTAFTSRLFGPAGPRSLGAETLAALPRTWMTAACMDARFRRAEGWLGLSQCETDPLAFTCRVAARPGVYGVVATAIEPDADPAVVDYALCYLPGRDDPMLDRFGLFAAILAAREDAAERMRDFPAHADLMAAFAVATLRLAVAADGSAIGLAVTAERCRRVLIEAGIPNPGGKGFLVEPGGTDEDLPAFDIARDLVVVLAAGLTVATEMAPTALVALEQPSKGRLFRVDDTLQFVTVPDAFADTDRLVWGRADPLERALDPSASTPRDSADLAVYRRAATPVVPAVERPESYGDRPRLIVLSGFLGSGKTSFLNQFIEFHASRNELVTVIQNELGETGVDAMLLEGDDSVMAVDAGCVCCTLAGALAPAIRALKDRFRPDVIVLETTGLANPLNMIGELRDLDDLIKLDAVVTVVDAGRFAETLAESDIAAGQIEAADTLVLNKCDLVDEATLDEIRAELTRRNPAARLLQTTRGRVNPKLLSEGFSRLVDEDRADGAPAAGNPSAPHHVACDLGAVDHPHTHEHEHGHEAEHGHDSHHDHHHHDDHGHHHGHDHDHDHASHLGEGFSYLKLVLPEQVDADTLSQLLVDCPSEVDRVKGVVRLLDEDGPLILQYVPGHAEFVLPERPITEEPFLIVIGKGVDSPAMRAHWAPLMAEASHGTH